jgi:hypothetical protein
MWEKGKRPLFFEQFAEPFDKIICETAANYMGFLESCIAAIRSNQSDQITIIDIGHYTASALLGS